MASSNRTEAKQSTCDSAGSQTESNKDNSMSTGTAARKTWQITLLSTIHPHIISRYDQSVFTPKTHPAVSKGVLNGLAGSHAQVATATHPQHLQPKNKKPQQEPVLIKLAMCQFTSPFVTMTLWFIVVLTHIARCPQHRKRQQRFRQQCVASSEPNRDKRHKCAHLFTVLNARA